jgi:LysM repeat protein
MAEKVKAKSGDTLSGIAKAQGTTVAQILKDNPTLAARQQQDKQFFLAEQP